MHLKSILIMSIIVVTILLVLPQSATAWYSGYAHQKSHAITASADGALTSYPMTFYIYKEAGVDSGNSVYLGTDGSLSWPYDIRFTNTTDAGSLYYFIRSYNDTCAIVDVKIDSIPSPGGTTIYIYYGKAGDSGGSDSANTYLLYDDFSTWSTTNWGAQPGWATLSSGILTVGSGNYLYSTSTFDVGTKWEAYGKFNSNNGYAGYSSSVVTGNLLQFYLGGGSYWRIISNGGAFVDYGTHAYDANWHTFTIRRPTTGDAVFKMDAWEEVSKTGAGAVKIALGGSSTNWDYVIVKKYTANEPGNGAWGSELDYTLPSGDFYSNSTSGNMPFDVNFTSTVYNTDNYYWYFGDGGTSETANPTYRYNMSGIYTVSLTLANANGTYTITKPGLINVYGGAHMVTFNVNNAGIIYYSGVNLSVYDMDTGAFIASTTTDSAGKAMLILAPKRYNITVTGEGINSISQSVTVLAAQDEYNLQVSPGGEWWNPFTWFSTNGSSTTGSPDQSRSITARMTGTLIGTTGYLDTVYNDTTGMTTNVNFTLFHINETTGAKEWVDTQNVAANNASYNFTILLASDKRYNVNVTGTNTLFGDVSRERDWHFKPVYSYDMGWPSYLYMFFAMGISLTIGYLSSKRNTIAGGAMLIVFLSAFWSIGWLNALGIAMPIMLGVLTILLVVYSVARWRTMNGV